MSSDFIQINYKEVYRNALNSFAKYYNKNEYSQDSLDATEVLIKLNPSFYAAWYLDFYEVLICVGRCEETFLQELLKTSH